MNKLICSFLATVSILCLTNCESFDDDDHDHRRKGTTTTTTEETTITRPLSTSVETQTTVAYWGGESHLGLA